MNFYLNLLFVPLENDPPSLLLNIFIKYIYMKITIHQSLKLKFLLLWHKILSHILFDSHVLTISQCTIPPLTHHFNHVCGYNDENRTIVITVRPIPFYWPRIHQRENVSRNVSLARRQIHLAVALDRANYTSRHI